MTKAMYVSIINFQRSKISCSKGLIIRGGGHSGLEFDWHLPKKEQWVVTDLALRCWIINLSIKTHFQYIIHFFSNFPAYYVHLSSNSLYKNSQGRAMYSLFRFPQISTVGAWNFWISTFQTINFSENEQFQVHVLQ
jgi:hypothetical protein